MEYGWMECAQPDSLETERRRGGEEKLAEAHGKDKKLTARQTRLS
jgi:hypothetical protein